MNLIMFDIDGTLVNSTGFDEACYLEAAERVLGVRISSNLEDYTDVTDAGILDEAIARYRVGGSKKRIREDFKRVFCGLVSDYLKHHAGDVQEIKGASRFLQFLRLQEGIGIAIATGGFEETAKMKLQAVGIDFNGLTFASSADHYRRTEIMKIAEERAAGPVPFMKKIYFGDASWDKKASEALHYHFVLVGNQIRYKPRIVDYEDPDAILKMLDLPADR